MPSPSLGLRYFGPLREKPVDWVISFLSMILTTQLFVIVPLAVGPILTSPSLRPLYPLLLLGDASRIGLWSPSSRLYCSFFSTLQPQWASSLVRFPNSSLGWLCNLHQFTQFFCRRILFLFPLLLCSLPLWHKMRPNLPSLSAASNANLKSGGLLNQTKL